MNAVVCIPIYQQHPDNIALASLRQTIQVIKSAPIVVIHPESLDTSIYKSEPTSFSDLRFQALSDHHFLSTKSYSRLLTSLDFYKLFSSYEHLLICQLDAWIFRDELSYWCQQDYAYIGAPCWQGSNVWIGNGGLSLRHIPSFLKVFSSKHIDRQAPLNLPIFKDNWRNLNWKGVLFKLFRKIGIRNSIRYHMNSGLLNEDAFWGLLAPLLYPDFHIPEWRVAARFSFETQPRMLYKLIGDQLPFGCHAWQKHDPTFWEAYIYP